MSRPVSARGVWGHANLVEIRIPKKFSDEDTDKKFLQNRNLNEIRGMPF